MDSVPLLGQPAAVDFWTAMSKEAPRTVRHPNTRFVDVSMMAWAFAGNTLGVLGKLRIVRPCDQYIDFYGFHEQLPTEFMEKVLSEEAVVFRCGVVHSAF